MPSTFCTTLPRPSQQQRICRPVPCLAVASCIVACTSFCPSFQSPCSPTIHANISNHDFEMWCPIYFRFSRQMQASPEVAARHAAAAAASAAQPARCTPGSASSIMRSYRLLNYPGFSLSLHGSLEGAAQRCRMWRRAKLKGSWVQVRHMRTRCCEWCSHIFDGICSRHAPAHRPGLYCAAPEPPAALDQSSKHIIESLEPRERVLASKPCGRCASAAAPPLPLSAGSLLCLLAAAVRLPAFIA